MELSQVNLVENKNIADEQSFMDPMGENGEELKSENDQLATRTDHMSGEFWRIKILKFTTQMRKSKMETQNTSCFGPSSMPGRACFQR